MWQLWFQSTKRSMENGTAYDIWKCFGPIWRGINGVQKVMVEGKEQLMGGKLDEKSYISAFRLGTYIATQFKPVVAKAIYDITEAKTVLDTSCGWGDRLAGFFASNAEEYYGCDPNPNTYRRYQEQISQYNKFLPKPKKVHRYGIVVQKICHMISYHQLIVHLQVRLTSQQKNITRVVN